MGISSLDTIGESAALLDFFPKINALGILEIAILTVVTYYIAKYIKTTRVWVVLKGLTIMLTFYALAYILNFNVIVSIFRSLLFFIGIAIVTIIQPELRKMIEKIGTKNINTSLSNLIKSVFKTRVSIQKEKRISDKTIQELIKGCFSMAKVKTGALIVIEGNIPLTDIIASGIPINGDITAALLINIFEKNTPLHDGAIVISGDKIVAGTCYLPLSQNSRINKNLGTRHRAAIGISEASDCSVIVVSEETGYVSFVKNGEIQYNLNRETLQTELINIQTINGENQKSADASSKEQKTFNISYISNNIQLKVVSLLATTLVWLLITSSINPVSTITFRNVPIDYLNTELLTDTGKTFTVNSNDYVSVTVKDRKDVIDIISLDDIKVIADFSKLSYVNSVPIEVEIDKYPNSQFILSDTNINISIEDVISTEVEIEVEKTGQTNEKYFISDINLSSNSVVISGAKSLVSTIDRVVVVLDESKLTSSTSFELEPVIYDKNGCKIDKSKLSISIDKIKVDVSLYNTKQVEINIDPDIAEEEIAELVDSVKCDTDTVVITGPSDLLDKYDKIDVSIPIDIKISDIKNGEYIKNIILQDYIPDGLMLTPQYNRVNITVNFKSFYSESIGYRTTAIEILNLLDGLEAEIFEDSIEIDFVSTEDILDSIDIDNIAPSINLDELQVGEYTIDLELGIEDTLDDNISLLGDKSITVIITEESGG